MRAARFFLQRTQAEKNDWDKSVWYLQASVLFSVSALEVLQYDFAEAAGLASKRENLGPKDFEKRARGKTKFYEWLHEELDAEPRYQFLRRERNLIVHRGEPPKGPKAIAKRPRQPSTTVNAYFQGWEAETAHEACESMLNWADSLILTAKDRYPELCR